MSFRKILVPVSGVNRDRFALGTALAAAKPFSAHVEALFVHADPRECVPYGELPLSPDIVQDLIDTAADLEKASSKSARSNVAAMADESSVRIVAAPQRGEGVTISYLELREHLPRALDKAARLCDLVVFPPIRETDDAEVQDAFIRTLMKVGRPVLLSPEHCPATVGQAVIIGWDGSVASAHALTAALPYLKQAGRVEILTVQSGAIPGNGSDVVAYLALHGVEAKTRSLSRGGALTAEVLLDVAAHEGFDLLVAGGYGHSQMAEAIFGGVTEHIVSHPRIPVFMMH
ncbi:nucleotide-binding universal stress UspA family protein [Rhizomicrobium palustre]|uniref:Nucleotide-binding universal stress UspA family protein n=1 Tax=Rhizomicrobium palustre TaxID=189966 RepID=A0A846MYZ7_9PROT|nr:universal stress protein [Rhizomicrobium palustre]NIK88469.1 nucleotide-binding universal stress UspA family protein [Rhizomicrobium palustre]